MKALFYTLILSAVLVGCIIVLLSIDGDDGVSPGPQPMSPVVSSGPPAQKKFDLEGMEAMEAEDIHAAGVELLDLWHIREATDIFEKAAARDSSFLDAFSKLVECYSHPVVCREDEARAAWKRARRIARRNFPSDTLFVAALGHLYIEADYEAASREFEQLLEGAVYSENILFYIANAYYRQWNLDKTEEYLEKLLASDESSGRARALMIRCAALKGDHVEAEILSKDLAALYSDEPYPYVLLSQVELLLGKYEEAFAFCNNALALDPKYIPAILCKGNLYAVRGNHEASRANYEKLLLFDDPVLVSLGSESIAFVNFLWGRFTEGTDMMDDAIRNVMLVGSVRRGLNYALRLVDYLCQLGRGDIAEDIIERWFSGFGDIPLQIGNMRLRIYNGNLTSVRRTLDETIGNREWVFWMRMLGMDRKTITALTEIKDRRFKQALEILKTNNGGKTAVGDYSYLRGYAAFENGDAELAAASFEEVFAYPRGLEFPYHPDPILWVQSHFYFAETRIARGDQEGAVRHYEQFLNFWGETDWEMQAVSRAREKLDTLSKTITDE